MNKARCILIPFVLLGFGVSLAVPAEDVLQTAYDESEALPYEGTPQFSIGVLLGVARATPAVPNSLHEALGAPSPSPPARVRNTDAPRSANARSSLALLCTLLC